MLALPGKYTFSIGIFSVQREMNRETAGYVRVLSCEAVFVETTELKRV